MKVAGYVLMYCRTPNMFGTQKSRHITKKYNCQICKTYLDPTLVRVLHCASEINVNRDLGGGQSCTASTDEDVKYGLVPTGCVTYQHLEKNTRTLYNPEGPHFSATVVLPTGVGSTIGLC